MSELYNVIQIVRGTTVDGPGFRTSVYLAGCSHKCHGCHNPQTWNPNVGTPMTLSEIIAIIKEEDFDVTLTGGDPLYYPEKCAALSEAIRNAGYNLWIYTGYEWEAIIGNPTLYNAIKYADTVVEGPFIEKLRDSDLRFRGSSNQRIIDVQKICDIKRLK